MRVGLNFIKCELENILCWIHFNYYTRQTCHYGTYRMFKLLVLKINEPISQIISDFVVYPIYNTYYPKHASPLMRFDPNFPAAEPCSHTDPLNASQSVKA